MEELQVIYEDNHLLAINKPAGLLVQGDRTGDACLADMGKTYLKIKYEKPGAVFLHPVHRIDRPVSGAVLLARTDKALGRLTEAFRDKKVQKIYMALTLAAPAQPSGRLTHWLIKDEAKNKVKAYDFPRKEAKESVLDFKVIGQRGAWFLLEIRPLTGRPHQIRTQLSAIGCPIVGDLKYGAKEPLPDASVALHCRAMELEHPVQKIPLRVEAEFPDTEIWKNASTTTNAGRRRKQ